MIITAIVTSLAALAVAGAHGWARRKQPAQQVIASGELLVTGRSEVVIDVPLPRSRGLLLKSELAASVEFKADGRPPPAHCGHRGDHGHDVVSWDIIERQRGGALYLVITWDVSSDRTVAWSVFGEGSRGTR
jgi:hypothetical protein